MNNYVKKNDAQLKEEVCVRLQGESCVNFAHIGVMADNGVVTLTGSTANCSEASSALLAASRVPGVRAIADELKVRTSDSEMTTDEEIAVACADRIEACPMLPKGAILVKVQDGWVTLDGQVGSAEEREMAKRSVQGVQHVKGISNLISVQRSVEPTDVESAIKAAFAHRALLDAQQIRVEAAGGTITLSGTVRSCMVRNEAERAARSVAKVTNVENRIIVSI